MKGIVLAGGSGTRLYPITKGVSKQLLPVYDKPMIYYPLSILMLAGIREILVITTPEDQSSFKRLLGNGNEIGIEIQYAIQPKPEGLAQAFIIGENFIGNDNVCLILGDNLFYGYDFKTVLKETREFVENTNNAKIFGYQVKDPQRYGVAEIDDNFNILSIEEKPRFPKSNYAVVGLYFYPNSVIKKAKSIKPSDRGELEITSINEEYLKENKLFLEPIGRGYAWLDTGTHDTLAEATEFVRIIENRQGLKISCLEEIAYLNGFISKKQALSLAKSMSKSNYGEYLKSRIK